MSKHSPPPARWLIDEQVDTLRSYSITVGAGLHSIAAIATMRTDGGRLGRLEFDGMGLRCMRVDGDHDFRTELRPGISQTVGMPMSTSDEALADPTIASI